MGEGVFGEFVCLEGIIGEGVSLVSLSFDSGNYLLGVQGGVFGEFVFDRRYYG